MRFRLFGIPVKIRVFFWITAVLFGLADPITIPLWVAVLFISILVHELGHAVAVMRHGIQPEIVLHGLGGTTFWDPRRGMTRWDHVLVSLAGPIAGLLLGGLVYAAVRFIPHGPLPALVTVAVADLLYVNIIWSCVNLLPVLPFDGGHVVEHSLGPRRARTTATISLVVAGVAAAAFAWLRQPWAAILFAMSAIQSYQMLTLPAGTHLVNPLVGGGRDRDDNRGGPGPFRRAWLNFKLKRLKAQEAAVHTERLRRREGGASLRVISGGADKPPKDKRYLN